MAELLATTASVIGIVDVGLRTGNGILEYCNAWRDGFEESRRIKSGVIKLRSTIKELQQSFGNSSLSPEIRRKIQECITAQDSAIDEILHELAFSAKSGLMGGVKKQIYRTKLPFKTKTVQKTIEVCKELMSRLGVLLSFLKA